MRKLFYRKLTCFTFLFCAAFFYKTWAQEANAQFPLIPYPSALTPGQGSFVITADTRIVSPDPCFANEALQLNAVLKQYLGKPLKQGKKATAQQILLQYDAGITAPEAYRLNITAKTVVLAAKEPAGMFKAVETVRQLLPADEHSQTFLKKVSLPAVLISDHPAFAWHGTHLDVSRHFFSIYAHLYNLPGAGARRRASAGNGQQTQCNRGQFSFRQAAAIKLSKSSFCSSAVAFCTWVW